MLIFDNNENENKFNFILSHINPDRTLINHLYSVAIGCKDLFKESCFEFNSLFFKKLFFENLANQDIIQKLDEILTNLQQDFIDLLIISGFSHDFGKGTSYFQEYLKAQKNNNNNFKKTELSNHSSISSIFGLVFSMKRLEISKNKCYLKSNPKLKALYEILPYIIYFIIKQHHSNLENFLDLLDESQNWKIEKQQFTDLNSCESFKSLYFQLLNKLKVNNIFLTNNPDVLSYDSIFELCRNILNTPQAIIDPLVKLSFQRTIKSNTDFKFFLFFLIKFLYSILINSDKMNTVFDIYQLDRIKDFPFWEELNKYRCMKKYDNPDSEEIFLDTSKINEDNKSKWLNILRTKLFLKYKENLNIIFNQINTNHDFEKNIFLIDLPTGLGKTLISLSVAFELRKFYQENYKISPRIIYALPFLSIIDQNYSIIKDIISNINNQASGNLILNQHHLSENLYYFFKTEEDYDSNVKKYTEHEANLLIEGWESELVVTTFHQFLNTIFSNSNKLNRRFHHYCSSIVILDEIQTIPSKYWNLLKKLFSILTLIFNIKIIILTATLPKIFPEDKSLNLLDLNQINPLNNIEILSENNNLNSISIRNELKKLNRIQINFDFSNYTIPDFVKKIFELTNLDEDLKNNTIKNKILIVLNTRKSARITYQTIINRINLSSKINSVEDKIYFLSSEIIPKNRLDIIKKIKESKEGTILISTQVIEAGVDLDFQFVFRDFAPLDSLIQVSGRCNRNNAISENKQGKVFIYNLIDDNDENNNQKSTKHLYSYQIYDPQLLYFTKCAILENSCNTTQEGQNSIISLNEQEFSHIIQKYYQKLEDYLSNHQEIQFEEYIEKLRFIEITKSFQLIEDFKNCSLFIEINDDAKSLISERKYILENYKGFELKHKLKDIGLKMNQYIISIYFNKTDLELFKNKLYCHNISFSENQPIIIPNSCVSLFYGKTGIIL